MPVGGLLPRHARGTAMRGSAPTLNLYQPIGIVPHIRRVRRFQTLEQFDDERRALYSREL